MKPLSESCVLHALKVARLNLKEEVRLLDLCGTSSLLVVARGYAQKRHHEQYLVYFSGPNVGFSEEEWDSHKQLGLLHLFSDFGLHISLMVACIERLWRSGITRENVSYWCSCSTSTDLWIG